MAVYPPSGSGGAHIDKAISGKSSEKDKNSKDPKNSKKKNNLAKMVVGAKRVPDSAVQKTPGKKDKK